MRYVVNNLIASVSIIAPFPLLSICSKDFLRPINIPAQLRVISAIIYGTKNGLLNKCFLVPIRLLLPLMLVFHIIASTGIDTYGPFCMKPGLAIFSDVFTANRVLPNNPLLLVHVPLILIIALGDYQNIYCIL